MNNWAPEQYTVNAGMIPPVNMMPIVAGSDQQNQGLCNDFIAPIIHPENESMDLTQDDEPNEKGRSSNQNQRRNFNSGNRDSRWNRNRDSKDNDRDRNGGGRDRGRRQRSTDRDRDPSDRSDRSRNDRGRENRERVSRFGARDETTISEIPGMTGRGGEVSQPANIMMPGMMQFGNNMMQPGQPAMNMSNMTNMGMSNMTNMAITNMPEMMPGMTMQTNMMGNMMTNMMPNMMHPNMIMAQQMQMMPQPIFFQAGVLLTPLPGMSMPARRERPPGCRTIFVGGLPPGVSIDTISEIFQRFGEIDDIKLHKQGVCYISFMKQEMVEQSFYLTGFRYKRHDQSDNEATTVFIDYALVSQFQTIDRLQEVLLASPNPVPSVPSEEVSQSVSGGISAAAAEMVTPPSDGIPKKLNGSARKRFRRLLQANVGADEARALAVKPWSQISLQNVPRDPKPSKRQRSEEESPKEQPKKAPRLEAPQGERPSYRQVAEAKRVGIHSADAMMSDAQMKLVHRSLTQALLDIEEKGKGPKFAGFTHKPGWILVTCENQESLGWLETQVSKIVPWAGAKLLIIPECKLPRPTVAITFVPSSEVDSVNEAVRLLGTQNVGLNSELWKVLHSRSEEGGFVITLSLDDLSVETLRATGFKATVGFKKVTFKVKGGPEEKPPSVATRVPESDRPDGLAQGVEGPQPSTSVGQAQGAGEPQPSTATGRGSSSSRWGGKPARPGYSAGQSGQGARPPAYTRPLRPPLQSDRRPAGEADRGHQRNGHTGTDHSRGRGVRPELMRSKPLYRRGNL